MEQISFDISRYTKPTTRATSERSELIEKFVTRLNKDRGDKYKPLSPAFYASKMSHIPTHELYAFYQKLDQSKSFSALWWWYNKPKNETSNRP